PVGRGHRQLVQVGLLLLLGRRPWRVSGDRPWSLGPALGCGGGWCLTVRGLLALIAALVARGRPLLADLFVLTRQVQGRAQAGATLLDRVGHGALVVEADVQRVATGARPLDLLGPEVLVRDHPLDVDLRVVRV